MRGCKLTPSTTSEKLVKMDEFVQRLAALEAEVAKLKTQLAGKDAPDPRWYITAAGAFANDPVFAEVVRLGREYRESLRPKRKPKATMKGRS